MEEKIVEMNEIEDMEPVDDEANEVNGSSNGGAFVAGVVGGFVAFALASGVKKLGGYLATKWEARKLKKAAAKAEKVVEAEYTEVKDEPDQKDSDEDAQNE